MNASGRTGWVDLFRGMAMILVVFAHVGRGLDRPLQTNFEGGFVDRWIYAFHMPAFFFAAGLFLAHSLEKGVGRYIIHKLRTVLYPYVLWSILFVVAQLMFSTASNSPGDPTIILRLPYQPVGHYWFLYVLFIVQILYLLAVSRAGRQVFWLICLIAWAVEPLKPFDFISSQPGTFWVWHNVMKYAVYVALGDWVAARNNDSYSQPATSRLYALIFFGLLTLMVIFGRSGRDSWWDLPLAWAGIQGLWELSVGLDNRKGVEWLRFLGRHSMEIFLIHTFATAAVRMALIAIGIEMPLLHIAIGTLAGILAPLAVWAVCRRLHFPYLFRV